MLNSLRAGLTSRNGFVRKGTAGLLQVPKWIHSFSVKRHDFAEAPPVLANSVPKSGTHLLMQVVEGLPDRVHYGAFLSSMTSSFQFRERTSDSVHRFIRHIAPGEVVRAHLFFDAHYSKRLADQNVVHYLIYRDPRDIAVSSAHYLRTMNRWHRLHKYFRNTESLDEALELTICGLQPPVKDINFPHIGARLARYHGWIEHDGCFAVRYEVLQSETRPAIIRKMAEFYAARCTRPIDLDACVRNMQTQIAPEHSHTYRSGKRSGWRNAFTRRHRELFHEVAGQLLIDWGYEVDAGWIEMAEATVPS